MIDKNIGYAHSFAASNIELFKTEDGGKTWNNWNVSFNHHPFRMSFVNKNQGYIAQRGDTLQASMMITSDGGLTWTEREYPEYEFFTFLLKDQNENIYSCTRQGKFIKSSDQGLTWENIISVYPSPSSYITSIVDDQIFFSGFGKDIFIFDLDGNILKKIIVQKIDDFQQMKIIDSMNIVLSYNRSTIKTSDGGESWSDIYDKETTIIDFPSPEVGLMVMNDNYCDIYQATVIGLTNDGGQTWMKSEEMEDFKSQYKSAQKVGDNHYLLLVGTDIYELKR